MGIFVKNSSQMSVSCHAVGDSYKYNTFYLVYLVDIKDIWFSQSAMSCNLHKKILKLLVSIVQEGKGGGVLPIFPVLYPALSTQAIWQLAVSLSWPYHLFHLMIPQHWVPQTACKK